MNTEPVSCSSYEQTGYFATKAELAHHESLSSMVQKPLYAQVADILRDHVYSGAWRRGSLIPSEQSLMDTLHVSRGTIRHAIKLLIEEDLLITHPGKGTYVADLGLSHPAGTRPLSFAESLREQGKQFITHVLLKKIMPAPPAVTQALRVEHASTLLFLRRVRTVDASPVVCQESWLNTALYPLLAQADFVHKSAFDIVEEVCKAHIHHSHMRYSARIAGKDHGKYLQVEETAPVLVLEQTIFLVGEIPVEYSLTWLPPGQSVVGEGYQKGADIPS